MVYEAGSNLDAHPLLEAGYDEKAGGENIEILLGKWTSIYTIFSRTFSLSRHLSILKPSFLTNQPAKRVHPTAWLDGLRGVAAFILIQLPVLRLFINGTGMVDVFWVLSGVALSLKPLQLARSQSWEKFMDTLFSSVFRRLLRLYLPCFAVSFCVMVSVLLGFYNHSDALNKDWPFYGFKEAQPPVMPTVGAQIADWASDLWRWANPLARSRHMYDPHFWTIPSEFRNSIILFATLAGHAKLKSRVRVGCVIALYLYCTLTNNHDVALFFGGMACAEYMLVLDEKDKQLPSSSISPQQKKWRFPNWLSVIFFYFSLHFLSFPNRLPETSLGYATLTKITPSCIKSPIDFWQTQGSVFLLFTLAGAKFLQTPFSSPLCVYLGKISFPLYIVHGPLNHMVAYRVIPFMWSITGKNTMFQYELGIVLAWLCQATLVVWTADFVVRVVDQPSVNFGRWLQRKWSV
ncbi:hypothetical protein GQ43DRAFT_458642 [Delitschia confertaspora ATCC 74209]|uniref:Acyltransferase 3 domain-containing protein n=1 Tax=Delitschia confertaspora ATCC 74209 TaxID=1513339 RepID=A0A9P4MUN3_9PLEO|nr:hypothetical protein GQ43DRAFT_458642 [Delitschia confertaspora ATCC 74209]